MKSKEFGCSGGGGGQEGVVTPVQVHAGIYTILPKCMLGYTPGQNDWQVQKHYLPATSWIHHCGLCDFVRCAIKLYALNLTASKGRKDVFHACVKDHHIYTKWEDWRIRRNNYKYSPRCQNRNFSPPPPPPQTGSWSSGGSKGGPKCSQFHAVFRKTRLKIICWRPPSPAGGLAPPAKEILDSSMWRLFL